MNRTEYLAARHNIENMGLTPDNVTGTLSFLDQQYSSEGGTPVTTSERSTLAAKAVAGNAAREAAIAQRAREYTQQNRLNGTPVTPEWAREHATAIVDLEAQYAQQFNQPEPTVAEYEAQFKADAKDKAESDAAYDKLVSERPQREAAKAAQELAEARVDVQRRALVTTGLSWAEATAAVPDAPTDVPAPAPSSLDKARTALFDPKA